MKSIKYLLHIVAIMFSVAAMAQSAVKGSVVDEQGLPIAGASVFIQGTAVGTATDLKGDFSINAQRGQTLVISFIGLKNQEIVLSGQTTLNVTLVSDTNILDEVVVVGYGTMRRSDLTGSIASVSGKDVEGYQSGSVAAALAGQVAGVQITSSDGDPSASFDIKIRGVGSITGDTSPLYIVDGFQMDNIDYLSNSDIESIEILKDASASAIYGSRAANGVVLVTTKQGKVGGATVTYNGSTSYRTIAKQMELLSPYEYVKLQLELNPSKYATTYFRAGEDADGIPYRYQTMEDYTGVHGVNWQSETFRPTWSQDHNVSLTGGNNNTKYTAGFSHFSEDGIFTNSSFEKTTARLRLNHKVTKYVTLDANMTYSNTMRKGVGTSADGGRFNMLAQIFSARPTGGLGLTDVQLLNEVIDPLELEEGGSSLAQVNPIVQAQSVTNHRRQELWQGNLALTFNLYNGLTLRLAGTYGGTYYRNDLFYKDGSKESYRNGQSPYGQTTFGRDLRYATSNYLTYKFDLYKRHKFEMMLGQEYTYRSSEWLLGQAKDFPVDNLGNDNLGLGATPSLVNSDFVPKKLASYFGRVNYNFSDRYLFTTTLRYDGSSVFADGNKWQWSPSFAFAWRISEEEFMKPVEWISNMKLRLGWGVTGNDRIANYLSLSLYEATKYGWGDKLITVFNSKQLPNSGIQWEGSATTNVGLDVGFIQNRLNVTFDAFVKDTKDLLLAKEMAYPSGFATYWENIGKIRNKGIEISINSVNFAANRGFRWTTDFNISFIRNSLVALQEGEKSLLQRTNFDSNYTDYDYIAMVDQPLGLMYGYLFDGIYQTSDFTIDAVTGEFKVKSGVVDMSEYYGSGFGPGCVKYKDVTGDGTITTEDRTMMGNGIPKFYGGLTNTFFYQGVDFSFMFQFNYGNSVYNATRMYATQSKLERSNKYVEIANRWTPANANNEVPSAQGYQTNAIYSRFIEDGSFLRLKQITLGYTLPKKITRKMMVNNLRVYVSAQNLFVVTGYKGYDPEVNMRSQNPMTPSFDWGAYPKSKIYTFGLDLTF